MKRRIRWFIGTVLLVAIVAFIFLSSMPVLFFPELPHMLFYTRCFHVLLLCCVFCLFRILRGPTAPDRAVAVDILGILIVGFCALLSIPTGRDWYMDIGIAWALQSFIATIALAKYIEGRDFDE
jgi:multicomponent Na+:H+ antiporter subunit F